MLVRVTLYTQDDPNDEYSYGDRVSFVTTALAGNVDTLRRTINKLVAADVNIKIEPINLGVQVSALGLFVAELENVTHQKP